MITPDSRCTTLSKIDGRTREGRLVKSLRSELVEHLGGTPSVTQRLLINQVCEIQLGIATMNRKSNRNTRDARTVLDWSNSLANLLQQIEMAASCAKQVVPAEAA